MKTDEKVYIQNNKYWTMNRNRKFFFLLICFILMFSIFSCQNTIPISLESLLDEMVSMEEMAKYPVPYYTCHQVSSYDRGSVSPDSANWFRNGDGYVGGSFIRIDTIDGRIEKVMLDHTGPGVITRIWITSLEQKPIIRFYFDGSDESQFVVPAYDMTQLGVAGAGMGMLIPHTSYSKNGVGGSTSYFPIPYAKGCKITIEIPVEIDNNPRYYQINYRKYEKSAIVETFSNDGALKAKEKIEQINDLLLKPDFSTEGKTLIQKNEKLQSGDSLLLDLPDGENAVYQISFDIKNSQKEQFAQIMRALILTASFDDKQTVWVPLSDFSGGGMGSPKVSSWFLWSDGKGHIISHWLMPYRKEARICLTNNSSNDISVKVKVHTASLHWDKLSLYFHASWKQNIGLELFHCNDDINNPDCYEWNFSTLSGRGIYRGDVLTLYNHSKSWYGEGDEKIWVDDDNFPSHFGTGTEDYYNSSWAPVVVFQTPFGGAMRADTTSSQGYNNWLRTRNLDGIPFKSKLQFDLELLSWFRGTADYASTVYWYGDKNAKAIGTSGIKEARRKLLPGIGVIQ